MNSNFDNQTKERVRQAVNIVDVIGAYSEVRRQGRNFVTRCPFHDDRRPSMQINAERQSWKCWVCDIGGDVFSFVMQREGMSFPEALQFLADKAGIVIETAGTKTPGASAEDKRELYRAIQWAVDKYRDYYKNDPAADAAREYVASRGLEASIVERFGLGFAPESWNWLADRALADKISLDALEKVGLLARGTSQTRYDRFRDRLIFPIFDPQSRPIALGGRVLPGSAVEAAKYINCSETRLYQKNQTLYGLNFAKDRITKTQVAVVVEGYTDVMMAHQHGIDNAVACCGTALTENHIRLLKRYCDSVVLMLDGDQAGQKRTGEILELFLSESMDLRILTLPEQLDPCDYLLRYGGESLKELLSQAIDALEFKIRSVCQGFDPLLDTHRATMALENVLGSLAKIPESSQSDSRVVVRLEQIIGRLSRQFGIGQSQIKMRLNDLRKQSRRWASPSGLSPGSAEVSNPTRSLEPAEDSLQQPIEYRYDQLSAVELELLEILAINTDLVPVAIERIAPRNLVSSTAIAIFQLYLNLELEGHSLDFQSILTATEDPSLKNTLVSLEQQATLKATKASMDPRARLETLCERWGASDDSDSVRSQRNALEDRSLDDQTQIDLLQSLIRQAQMKHGIEQP
ncbi:MAG: DNA primase [Planctomycetaceae bacterium]|jgi:DNA primase|nr:DNA primase [Planctomycetaceae bacterium]MCE2812705.1 DNA primase [Planctomycetaceae bacterium]